MSRSNTDSRKTTEQLLRCIQQVFKGSTRGARERAWSRITSAKGRTEVGKLINNPDRNIELFRDLVTFKEFVHDSQEFWRLC